MNLFHKKIVNKCLLFLGFNCRGSLSSVAILLLEGSHHLLLLQGLNLFHKKIVNKCLLFLGFNCRGSLSSVAILLLEGSHHLLLFQGLSLFTPLTRLLHLVSSGIGLIGKHLGPGLLCLLLVNMFHEDTLVLESVTL